MSYRVHEHPKHKARRSVEATASPMRFFITNGTAATIAFPCFYQEIKKPIPAIHHSVHYHHHVGWPVYNHPDHICQMAGKPGLCGHQGSCKTCRHYLDPSTIFPIHLADEGYSNGTIAVCLDNNHLDDGVGADQVYASAIIDEYQDWVIKIIVNADIQDHFDRPQRIPFAIRATRPNNLPWVPEDDKAVRTTAEGYADLGAINTIAAGELIILPSPLDVAPPIFEPEIPAAT